MAIMMQLSEVFINRPIMSLRTGTQVATAVAPIVNPKNLKIEAFYCQDSLNRKKQLIMVDQDIRDLIPQGFVINDHDVLVEPQELVRLKEVMQLNFQLIGKPVQTVSGQRLGKITDFATDINSMFIQKLYISQSVFKNLTGGNLGIDRTQIVEITPRKIVVNDLVQNMPANARAIA